MSIYTIICETITNTQKRLGDKKSI